MFDKELVRSMLLEIDQAPETLYGEITREPLPQWMISKNQ